VQQLQDFHSQHGNCVGRAAYDEAHQERESIRQEYEAFKNKHQDCDAIAEQLGQLQEERQRSATPYFSVYDRRGSSASGTSPTTPGGNITTGMGSMGLGFQVPGTPRSGLQLAIPQTPAAGFNQSPFGQAQSPGLGGQAQPLGFGQSLQSGTIGQGSSAQSSSAAGTFGPPLPQPTTGQYSFLVSGELATGPRTLTVDLSLPQKMNAQIARWTAKSHVNWSGSSTVSHKRCSETRVQQFKKSKNPPASENPNEACANCVANKILCVLVGENGPVVMPLPVSERSPGCNSDEWRVLCQGID
jgi:hypothetical protein